MLQSKDKISLRQVMLMCLVVIFSPTVRVAGRLAAQSAKQAGWISGILSIIPAVLIAFILSIFFSQKKYSEANIMDVIKDIMGNIPGRMIILVYLLWLMLFWGINIRTFGERIVGTIMPNADISIFIISLLIVVTLALNSGITVIARMNEIIIVIITLTMYIFFLFGLPMVKIENLTPVYFTDIWPAFSGSSALWNFYGYLIIFFFFGNQINDKEKLTRFGLYQGVFLVITNTLLIAFTIGTLGYSLVARLPRATYVFIKQISVFGVVERLESFVVITWVLSDFIIIAIFAYAILCTIKDFFKLSDYKPLILPLVTLGYFLSLLMVNNVFELEKAAKYLIAVCIIMEYIVPFLILIVGKVRKKI